ncbi:endonuclease III [Acetobacter pasteurianus]|uniref:endonuclease III n=1 Tax=Acetobacter pasteurianus TaxID=438 RepID=UPI000F58C0C3|nr:endonuclease III [Acetobacter pasteurianus]
MRMSMDAIQPDALHCPMAKKLTTAAPVTSDKPMDKSRAKKRTAAKKTAPATPSSGPAAIAPRDMTPQEIYSFLTDLSQAWPDAQTELLYTTPFTLLVAVVLSAQATDASVNRVTPALFEAAPTPAAMVELGEEEVGKLIRTIGLWRNKAKNVVELSRQLVEDHHGEVPGTREELEKLAGVGRKTANVVLNVAFHKPTVPVDTHVFRLANRSGLGRGKPVEAVEKALEARIPLEMIQPSHHWMILQGRYVCKARKPECWRCNAKNPCLFPDKTPAPRVKAPKTLAG